MVDKKILLLSTLILLVFVMSVIPIHIQKIDIKAVEQVNNTDSSNWAGYIAASSISNPQAAVTGISGSWIVQIYMPSIWSLCKEYVRRNYVSGLYIHVYWSFRCG